MHIIALSTNLFAIFNLFFVKNTRIQLLLLELVIFLELHGIFYFEIIFTSENVYVEKCFIWKRFTSKNFYFEIFFTPKNFQFFSLVHRLRIFLFERNKYRLNSFRIFRMKTGKRSASDSFGRRYTNKVTISCRRWIKCLANERASEWAYGTQS